MNASNRSGLVDDKVFFVAGVGPHIGSATALIASREGARVALVARNSQRTEEVAESIRAAGGTALALTCDVGKPDQLEAAVKETVAQLGPVDVVFYNAAYYYPDHDRDLVNFDEASWQESMAVNLGGAVTLSRLVIPSMLQRGKGSFVFTSSNAAVVGEEVHLGYGVFKSGMNGLCRFVASRYGRQGIRANAIFPFVVEGDHGDQIGALSCLGRSGTAEEIGEVVVFLASDRAAAVTGQEIHVDCGLQVKAHWPSSFVAAAPMANLFTYWDEVVKS
jgi:NAD(P)-dependent dehydrogenase (short-subunit alcohol dehydrogenase family)